MPNRWKPNVTVAAVIERDGRFLLVEEDTSDGIRLNNPAGHIDPGEWVVSYWFTRVGAAEAWLEAAEALSPGREHMKPTDQNRERVAKARALLQQGISKKDIASQLGISQSHLSHLLRRH